MEEKSYLAIFDMDGTLFDTGNVNFHAYRQAIASYGIELTWDKYNKFCDGRHYTEFLPRIMGTNRYIEEVHAAKKKFYRENLDKARINKHLFSIIDAMRTIYHLAVVTTASRENTMEILTHFGFASLFELILTQEDIIKLKPDPEGFLLAMTHFGTDEFHTVIFEDSDVGIQAAIASGASVIRIERF